MDKEQGTMNNGQGTMNNGQGTIDNWCAGKKVLLQIKD
jgi:hypothetical protein